MESENMAKNKQSLPNLNPQKGVRVELVGLPGSGKSHIQKYLIKALKLSDKKRFISPDEAFLQISKNKIDRVYRLILNCLPHRMGLIFSQKLINRSYMQYDAQNRFLAKWGKAFEAYLSSPVFDQMTVEDREIRISVFLNTGAIFECINDLILEEKIVLFDELFVQKSFIFVSHLIDCSIDESGLYRYLENIPLSDIVIHVKADINTCYNRMLSRERGVIQILKDSGQEDIMKFFKTAEVYINTIVDWLTNRKNIILLEIENYEVDEAINKLESQIRAITDK